MNMADPDDDILTLDAIRTEFRTGGQWHAAVRDLSLTLRRNETLAVVGESGSGKSVTALTVMRLLSKESARIAAGRVLFEGRDLLSLTEGEMGHVRGNSIAMIFQEPMTSLNPTMKVGEQIAEAIMIHRGKSKKAAMAEALSLLHEVNIPAPELRINDYPHEFSGGMRQRVMIAIALACRPKVLLADEPTTALDVTIQAQVLMQLASLREAYGMSVIVITHNLGVVAQVADRVAVMYAGEIVEIAEVDQLFEAPTHPYTQALLRAMPRVDRKAGALEPLPGSVPAITNMPPGCAFADRCNLVQPSCRQLRPALQELPGQPGHMVRCPVVLAEGDAK